MTSAVTDVLPQRHLVERDAEGMKFAVRTLFEENLRQHKLAQILDRCSAAERARIEADEPIREISPGYYKRAAYLLQLANTLELGIPFPPDCFTMHDVAGIQAVRLAKAEFEREHPACPRCGERQDNPHMPKCPDCGQKLRSSN
jgi:ribosomal protein S27AE